MSAIVLFKEADERYETALHAISTQVQFVPLLRVVALDAGAELARPCDALMFTSLRALEVFRDALRSTTTALEQTTVYALGERQCEFVRQLPVRVRCVYGDECGNADELVNKLLQQQAASSDGGAERLRVHFLCGEKRMPTIERALAADTRFQLHVTPLYETVPVASVPLSESVLHSSKWLVFFSPSGVDIVANSSADSIETIRRRCADEQLFIACIGETTAAAVRATLAVAVSAVAAKPTPEALATAMKQHRPAEE
jgi:uroporphyrinogen-III synthase